MVDEISDAVDRISDLPEPIIDHIISFLRRDDVVRTSVLSKRWKHMWASFHVLDFDQFYFERLEKDKETFFDHVERSLSRFMEYSDARIWKFRLVVKVVDFISATLVEKWMKVIVKRGFEELDLWIYPDIRSCYLLILSVLASNSPKVLKLRECSVLVHHLNTTGMKFMSLRKLTLDTIKLGGKLLDNIISTCPLIEELALIHCYGLSKIQVNGLHVIKRFDVIGPWKELEAIEVNASSLVYFHYDDEYAPFIDLSKCQNLKHLSIWNSTIEAASFDELISKTPSVEVLDVISCDMLETFHISSLRLKRFALYDCKRLAWFDLDAPNLNLFLYKGNLGPLTTSTGASSGKWEVKLDYYFYYDFDTLTQLELRKLISRKSHQFKALTLSLAYGLRLCKELLVCQKDDIDCCDSWRVKCWRHYLKAATVEGYEGMEDERLIAFLDAAAKTLPGDQKIQFRLKW
ncbi:F-box/LRR-repeat protein [Actinidia chinensis var. chinensis]|uniref:F-box/LRR-repeat protein n=1 Tax=Actinidia chinensis var. chinensis TaxID=1590841 RepID=A0A2R6PT83_ACTCC|nr:F-box/LRR-repeat protein [Actinidia chinensis var. chinensis]